MPDAVTLGAADAVTLAAGSCLSLVCLCLPVSPCLRGQMPDAVTLVPGRVSLVSLCPSLCGQLPDTPAWCLPLVSLCLPVSAVGCQMLLRGRVSRLSPCVSQSLWLAVCLVLTALSRAKPTEVFFASVGADLAASWLFSCLQPSTGRNEGLSQNSFEADLACLASSNRRSAPFSSLRLMCSSSQAQLRRTKLET